MAPLPPLLTQLDNGAPTAGDDCAVMTLLNIVRVLSDGKVGPHRHDEVDDWVRQVRQWAGKPSGGLLMLANTFRAYQHPDLRRAFSRHGLIAPHAEYRHNVGWATLLQRARNGDLVHLAVDYGALNRGNAPSGSLTFRGGHSVAIVRPHKGHRAHTYVWDGDPLMDGRTRYVNGERHTYPKGWQEARLLDFRAAAGAWGASPGGAGHATAIFVRRG